MRTYGKQYDRCIGDDFTFDEGDNGTGYPVITF